MEKKEKTILLISLMLLLLTSMFSHLQPITADSSTYILADGQINPPNNSIQRKGDLYIFTGNVSDGIVVEKNSIILDGNGYALTGSGDGIGISLSGRENVTIKNLQIQNFAYGISFGGLNAFSINNKIIDNNITQNKSDGLYLDYYSNFNTITSNIIAENNNGIYLYCSSNNNISKNNIVANSYEAVSLSYSSDGNSITGNNIAESWVGVTLEHVTNNRFYQNNFVGNVYQVQSSIYANTWDNGQLGNYWSDFNVSDSNGDGVGDRPYIIDASNIDRYPLTSKLYFFPQYTLQSTRNQNQQNPTQMTTATPSTHTNQPTQVPTQPSGTIPEGNTGTSPTGEPIQPPTGTPFAFETLTIVIVALFAVIAILLAALFAVLKRKGK
jgi:parallel beta-helix repeat protein